MSRKRKQLITNLYVTDSDIKRLTNGFRVFKQANKHAHCIIPKHAIAKEKKEALIAKQEAKVKREMARLALLQGKDTTEHKKYTKRNLEYWNKLKDPNVMKARLQKGEPHVEQTTL